MIYFIHITERKRLSYMYVIKSKCLEISLLHPRGAILYEQKRFALSRRNLSTPSPSLEKTESPYPKKIQEPLKIA